MGGALRIWVGITDSSAGRSNWAPRHASHFATALDDQLLTVPQITFDQYADGLIGNSSEITGGFTSQSASDLATRHRGHPGDPDYDERLAGDRATVGAGGWG
jgi:hypothetical protein